MYTRTAITAALVKLQVSGLTGLPLSTGANFEAGDESSVAYEQTIARTQSISTNDELSYAPVFQMGYAGVVEHVPLRTQGSGQLNALEVMEGYSLYRLGIVDFVGYLVKCRREQISISLLAGCDYDSDTTSKEIDKLPNVKFTSVARLIEVNGQLVSNSAAFVYIRSLKKVMEDFNTTTSSTTQYVSGGW